VRHPGGAPVLFVERHLPRALHLPEEPRVLDAPDLVGRAMVGADKIFIGRREFPPESLEIEGGGVAGHFDPGEGDGDGDGWGFEALHGLGFACALCAQMYYHVHKISET
jgi:hypothetical protein